MNHCKGVADPLQAQNNKNPATYIRFISLSSEKKSDKQVAISEKYFQNMYKNLSFS
jgi:hypothetical protein